MQTKIKTKKAHTYELKKKHTHTHKHQSKVHQCKKKPTTKQSKDFPQNIRINEMTESSLIFTFLL
jgi:hypothetical protein